jgi:hypothetical protein
MESDIEETPDDASLEWDPMSWMTSDNEVEIWARSMEDEAECEVFFRNFGGY